MMPKSLENFLETSTTSKLMLGRHLLERPGFMGDPFVDTARNLFGNAHCMSPTKLDGYDGPSAEFLIRRHNAGKSPGIGMQILWRIGQVMTLARFQKADMLLVDRA